MMMWPDVTTFDISNFHCTEKHCPKCLLCTVKVGYNDMDWSTPLTSLYRAMSLFKGISFSKFFTHYGAKCFYVWNRYIELSLHSSDLNTGLIITLSGH